MTASWPWPFETQEISMSDSTSASSAASDNSDTSTTQAATTSESSGEEQAAAGGDTGGEQASEGGTSEPGEAAKATLLGGDEEGQGGADKEKSGQSEVAEIEITLPEGYEMDEKVLERFKPFAQELKLSSDQASKLAKFSADERTASLKDAEATLNEQSEGWRKEIENDPDFGRTKLEESSAFAKRGVEFAGEKVRDTIVKYGLGNHPDFYRFFSRLGQAVGDDNTFVAGGIGGSGKTSREERRAKMYPTMNEDGTEKVPPS